MSAELRKTLIAMLVAAAFGAAWLPSANAWTGLDQPSPSKYAGVDSVGTSLPWTDYLDLVDPNPAVDSDGVVTRSAYYLVCEFIVDIGFDFTYYGKTYRKVAVSPWGYIRPVPDGSTTTLCYTYFPYSKLGTTSPAGVIAGLWTQYSYWSWPGGTVKAGAVGPPGAREFAVQYSGLRESTSGMMTNFEIRLYQTDNHIEVRIRDGAIGYESPWFSYAYYTGQGIQDGVYGVSGVTRGLDKQYSGYCYWSPWSGGAAVKCRRVFDDIRTIYMPAPQLDFKVDPKPPCPGRDATFTAKYMSPIGPPDRVTWSFGGEGETAVHSFADGPADVEVKMTAEFDYGFTMDWTKTVHVNGCKPPVAVFRVDVFGSEAAVNEESYDLDGRVKKWEWDWGDGSPVHVGRIPPAHPYSAEGNYDIRLTVTDNEGYTDTVTQTARIQAIRGYLGPKPVADAGPDQVVQDGQLVQLDGSGADGNRAVRVTWTQLSGPVVDLVGGDTTRPSFTPAPITENAPQVYGFALQIFDGFRTSDPDLVVITVEPRPPVPVADAGADQTVLPNMMVALDGSGSRDAFGNPLTYEWTQVAGPAAQLDGKALMAPSFQAPDTKEPVEYVFQLKASNGQETSAPDTVKVLVQPPVASGADGFRHSKSLLKGPNVIEFEALVEDVDPQAMFEWDFGDQTAGSTGSSVEHTYMAPGTYPVTLRVLDSTGSQIFQGTVDVGLGQAVEAPAVGEQAVQSSPGVAPLLAFALVALAAIATRRRAA